MSNMIYETDTILMGVNILKRAPFEGIAISLDFTNVSDVDAYGNKIVKAGSPISALGVVDNTADAIGILLHDVTEERPQGTILKKAYINTSVAQTHSGVTIAAAVKSALPMIVFE